MRQITNSIAVAIVALVYSSVSLHSTSAAEDKESTCESVSIDVTTPRKGDRVAVSVENGETILTVTSQRGIGRATLTHRGDDWPESIVLRLQLRGLESLKITSDSVTLEASQSSTGDQTRSLRRIDKQGKGTELKEGDPYWTELKIVGDDKKIPLDEGYFELALPPKLWEKNPDEIQIRWIDFYR